MDSDHRRVPRGPHRAPEEPPHHDRRHHRHRPRRGARQLRQRRPHPLRDAGRPRQHQPRAGPPGRGAALRGRLQVAPGDTRHADRSSEPDAFLDPRCCCAEREQRGRHCAAGHRPLQGRERHARSRHRRPPPLRNRRASPPRRLRPRHRGPPRWRRVRPCHRRRDRSRARHRDRQRPQRRDAAPDQDGRPHPGRDRERRHRHGARARRRRGPAAAAGRHRHVRGQGAPQHGRDVLGGVRPEHAAPAHARWPPDARARDGDRAQPDVPAHRGRPEPRDRLRRGAVPLEPPGAGVHPAGGVHRDRRADGSDPPDHRLRPARGLRPAGPLARRRHHHRPGRERVRDASSPTSTWSSGWRRACGSSTSRPTSSRWR